MVAADLGHGFLERRRVTGLRLLIILIMLLMGAYPAWPYSRDWGYRPSGLVRVLLAALIVLLLFEVVPFGWRPHY